MDKIIPSRSETMKICRNLDKIAADCRDLSAEIRKRVSIYTHVHGDGTISFTVKPDHCEERLEKHFWELKRITTVLWKGIFIEAETNRSGQSASTINADGYRKDHFYDGYERLTFRAHEIEAKQVVFGGYPIGMETDLYIQDMKRLQR